MVGQLRFNSSAWLFELLLAFLMSHPCLWAVDLVYINLFLYFAMCCCIWAFNSKFIMQPFLCPVQFFAPGMSFTTMYLPSIASIATMYLLSFTSIAHDIIMAWSKTTGDLVSALVVYSLFDRPSAQPLALILSSRIFLSNFGYLSAFLHYL